MLVKDIMSKKVLSVSKEDSVQKFISLMQKKMSKKMVQEFSLMVN